MNRVTDFGPKLTSAYRFKSGKFEGMAIEKVMLRYAPWLYWLSDFAEDKPKLRRMLAEFDRLRHKLRHASIQVSCAKTGCKHTPKSMTLPMGWDRHILPSPYFWCDRHEPWETDGISPKLSLHFDTLRDFEGKKNRSAVHESILQALGIRKKSRITEKFALRFFAALP